MRYIDDLKASWVFPIAGPPCFLDDELWQFNDIFGDEGNIFPDQQVFVDHYRELGLRQRGDPAARAASPRSPTTDCTVSTRCRTSGSSSRTRRSTCAAYQDRQRPVIEAAKASWRHPEIDVLKELKRRIEPLLEESIYLAKGVGGPVRFDLVGVRRRDRSSPSWSTSRASRCGRTPTRRCATASAPTGPWSSTCSHIGEVDWVNSLFLSCRFSAARIGQYNEFVYAFFKCLSEERLQYAEGWYAEQKPDAEDVSSATGWCSGAART